jgi:hypothetical protein
VSFHEIILKNGAADSAHKAVTGTLQMMSNNRRSTPAINAHLPVEEACREYHSSNSRKLFLKNGGNHLVSDAIPSIRVTSSGFLYKLFFSSKNHLGIPCFFSGGKLPFVGD